MTAGTGGVVTQGVAVQEGTVARDLVVVADPDLGMNGEKVRKSRLAVDRAAMVIDKE
ncbi:vegetative cell wall protein gp1 [Iris pallida]|uniref:Vegetative cell wall protein gp1 n=1 Tax=Iris pallida TaxID=29817 RepID=A0AAX6E6X7_IRIPA|nr:vegetative cell wall protein gp1 [Iris pallida]